MRPKKTLFGFTRKRIFDTLLMRHNVFEVISQKPLPSHNIRFKYAGKKIIEIIQMPESHGGIMILTYTRGSGAFPKKDQISGEYTSRGQINERIARIFADKSEVQNHGC